MNNIKIGIIGFGNMGQAIANKLADKYDISVFDKDSEKLKNLTGVSVTNTIIELVNKTEAIILAIKPQDFDFLLSQIASYVEKKLIISIAAGISTIYLEQKLTKAKIIRVMPNLAAKIGLGVTGITKGKFANQTDLNFAKKLFDNLGKSFIVKEEMMNVVTAVSGSGPGIFYEFINGKYVLGDKISLEIKKDFTESLAKAAIELGFDLNQAKKIAKATVLGSIVLLKETNLSPAQLRDKVASKAGTTEAGIKVLQSGGTVVEAVKAAKKRADELNR